MIESAVLRSLGRCEMSIKCCALRTKSTEVKVEVELRVVQSDRGPTSLTIGFSLDRRAFHSL